MTDRQNRLNGKDTGYSTFGGIIYSSDFNTEYRKSDPLHGSSAARRIEQDFKFDEQCRQNILYKKGGAFFA